MQPTTLIPCCTLGLGPHRGIDLQHCGSQRKMSQARHTQRSWSLAACNSDHTFTVHAARLVHPQQHRKSPSSLHSVSPLQGTSYAGRSGTKLAAGNFMGLMGQILNDMSHAVPSGSSLTVNNLSYHPAGSPVPLLTDLSLQLPANQLGLIYGRSGAGKTTLLQLLAGLTEGSSGRIQLGAGGTTDPMAMTPQELAKRCGLVFQFPERYFLGGTLQDEIVFGWPFNEYERQAYAVQAHRILEAVGLKQIPVATPLQQLSGGYKRRVALAVQLVRRPAVLLLDEPLAGLDWKARMEVAETLKLLKKNCTILVVSHDLRELSPLVDKAWKMQPGGRLEASPWPI
ncbi:hypothetical protein ABBQ32_005712 [Trebouxia sp. C0010 RCD-2024]